MSGTSGSDARCNNGSKTIHPNLKGIHFECPQIGFPGVKIQINIKQNRSVHFFHQRTCQSLFDHITQHATLVVGCWSNVDAVPGSPSFPFFRNSVGVASLVLALNQPQSGLLICNHAPEGPPVDISCSFLNQLKGPQDLGQGFW